MLDALPCDPAWHVSKLVFGFSHGRSCVYGDMAFVRDVPRRIAWERVLPLRKLLRDLFPPFQGLELLDHLVCTVSFCIPPELI
jgi:hypothetical protein